MNIYCKSLTYLCLRQTSAVGCSGKINVFHLFSAIKTQKTLFLDPVYRKRPRRLNTAVAMATPGAAGAGRPSDARI